LCLADFSGTVQRDSCFANSPVVGRTVSSCMSEFTGNRLNVYVRNADGDNATLCRHVNTAARCLILGLHCSCSMGTDELLANFVPPLTNEIPWCDVSIVYVGSCMGLLSNWSMFAISGLLAVMFAVKL
jgi:hypothetical protein